MEAHIWTLHFHWRKSHSWEDLRHSKHMASRGSVVKNLPEMQETQVQSLGWEDSLEKEMATHSGIHAWKMPWTEKPGGLQAMGSQESDTN